MRSGALQYSNSDFPIQVRVQIQGLVHSHGRAEDVSTQKILQGPNEEVFWVSGRVEGCGYGVATVAVRIRVARREPLRPIPIRKVFRRDSMIDTWLPMIERAVGLDKLACASVA